MLIRLRKAKCYTEGRMVTRDVFISGGSFCFDSPSVFGGELVDAVIDNCIFTPGFLDVHVHLREPGFSYKETIKAGTLAAARGGYTGVCSMPNLDPAPDCLPALQKQLDIISRDACVSVFPYGTITRGEAGDELSDMDALAPLVCGFSDDGRGLQSRGVMLRAMKEVTRLEKIICAHCEDNSLLRGGYINDCEYARLHGHPGICAESEWGQIARDLELAAETGCRYHVCHISTGQSAQLIREAKRRGVRVTCETAPHYLLLCDRDLCEDARYKMNPPLRSPEDRAALIEAVCDGTIDCIATDHAPHTDAEKARGLASAPMGITGLEAAFPVLYEGLAETRAVPLERLLDMMCGAPRRIFGLDTGQDSFSVLQYGDEYKIDSSQFASMGHSTPFDGSTAHIKCIMTVHNGRTVWQSNTIKR